MESTETVEIQPPGWFASRSAGFSAWSARAFGGVAAVGVKELRGRMRGRRAFIFLTFYLAVLTGFAWMIQLLMEANAANNFGSTTLASAQIGRAIFVALLMLETLLVLFLAPAYTTGAISLEREKQTLDLLAVTPISSLSIVLGKLLSALTFVFLLILSSVPLTAIVFTFGGVGPEDVLRGYIVLIVAAIGLGSIGLFCSSLVRRTQAATILTYFTVLALTLGTGFVFFFWNSMTGWRVNAADQPEENMLGSLSRRAPEALLYFNPFVAQVDVFCGTETGGGGSCEVIRFIIDKQVGFAAGGGVPEPAVRPIAPGGVGVDGVPADGGFVVIDPAVAMPEVDPFGAQRDLYWPRSAVAWLVVSLVLILASVQLVSPTRRWHLRRRRQREPAGDDL